MFTLQFDQSSITDMMPIIRMRNNDGKRDLRPKRSRSSDSAYRRAIWPAGKTMGAHNRCREHVPSMPVETPKRVRKSRAKVAA